MSFHQQDTPLELELFQIEKEIVLRVTNQGPPIPEELRGQIFNSMVSQRTRHDSRPHLGLGLYVARTIVLHHKGSITVENLADGRDGVVFTLRFPLFS